MIQEPTVQLASAFQRETERHAGTPGGPLGLGQEDADGAEQVAEAEGLEPDQGALSREEGLAEDAVRVAHEEPEIDPVAGEAPQGRLLEEPGVNEGIDVLVAVRMAQGKLERDRVQEILAEGLGAGGQGEERGGGGRLDAGRRDRGETGELQPQDTALRGGAKRRVKTCSA